MLPWDYLRGEINYLSTFRNKTFRALPRLLNDHKTISRDTDRTEWVNDPSSNNSHDCKLIEKEEKSEREVSEDECGDAAGR